MFSITLVAALGLSLIPINTKAQEPMQAKVVQFQQSKISLTGTIRAQENGNALEKVQVEAKIGLRVIATSSTDSNGVFNISIDTARHPLSKIEIHFSLIETKTNVVRYKKISGSQFDRQVSLDLNATYILNEVEVVEYEKPLIDTFGLMGTVSVVTPKDSTQKINKD